MDDQVKVLVKKVDGDLKTAYVTPNEFFDFGVKEAEAYLGYPQVRQTVLKKEPESEVDMFSATEGYPNFTRVNGEMIYGDVIILRRKYVNSEYTQFMAEDITDEDEAMAIHDLSLQKS